MATPEEMELEAANAEKAFTEMKDVDEATVLMISNWWNDFFKKCGHKRLGRILVAHARNNIGR